MDNGVFLGRDRISLGSFQYVRYSLPYFLETARKLQIPFIDLYACAPHFNLDLMTPQEVSEKAKLIRGYGLQVFCITPEQVDYPWNLAAEDAALRKESIAHTMRAIDSAGSLSCENVLVTGGRGYYDKPKEEAWERSKDSLTQLASYASARGVRLLLETLTPASSNVINTPDDQRRMISEIPYENIGAVMDIGQMVVMKQPFAAYLEPSRLPAQVHLHDSHPAVHMALGEGDLPLTDILAQLEQAGYTGKYTIESNDTRYRLDPRASDEQSVRWLAEHRMI